jgi:hypothetical protein
MKENAKNLDDKNSILGQKPITMYEPFGKVFIPQMLDHFTTPRIEILGLRLNIELTFC